MKNMIKIKILPVFIVFFISACNNTPNAIVDYNQSINFQSFKIFQFSNNLSISTGKNPIIKNRIKKAIINNLISKNLILKTQGNEFIEADLIISLYISQQALTNDSSLSIGIGSVQINRHSGINIGISTDIPLTGNTTMTKITIDISHKDEVIWHGSKSYQSSNNMTTKEKDKKVFKVIDELFTNFPPKN